MSIYANMFHIHATQGQGGGRVGISFPTLPEALAYIEEHAGEASFAIEYPDGSFHEWTEEDHANAVGAHRRMMHEYFSDDWHGK